jgi:hypothetical protein
MSLRIKTNEDLKKLGLHARKQVKALAPNLGFTNTLPRGHTPRVITGANGLKCRPWPPKDPAVKLHQMLLKHFGCINSKNGCIASEVIIPGSDVRYRFDFLVTTAKVVIEFDGYRALMSKDAFQNDRNKQFHAHATGFLLHRVTNKDVRMGEDFVIERVKRVIAQRDRYDIKLKAVGHTQCEVVEATLIYCFTDTK